MRVQMDPKTIESADALIQIALTEDMGDYGDLTSNAMVAADAAAHVNIVARESGVVCGIPLIARVFSQLEGDVRIQSLIHDGDTVHRGSIIAKISGPVRLLLGGERTVLNFMIHLSGIASGTAKFVEHTHGTRAVILDTRKTLPGYRSLHKYAVRCGGGTNHRMGLYDGILIKDNHLAARGDRSLATAVAEAREHIKSQGLHLPIEIEVDTLDQFRDALAESPEIVLLDNMDPADLAVAVEIRDQRSPSTKLEASGGVTLQNIRAIAESGVDRISIGGLTHSSPALDLGFDWPW